MSAKPSVLAPWATTTNYPHDGAPEQDTPTKVGGGYPVGKQTLGFRPDEEPDATELNDLFNRYGLWIQYLSDGAFAGPITVAGDLTVTGGDTLFDFGGGGTFEIISAAPIELAGDLELDVGHTITVDGRNNRGLLMGAAATSFLSRDVPIDSPSWDHGFAGGGTMSRADTTAGEPTLIFSTATAHSRGYIPLEPGDEIEYVTVVYDGPVATGAWPDINILLYTGQQLVAVNLSTTTDATAANQHRIGSGTTGAGRTIQRYTVASTEPIANGKVNNLTTWQLGGTAYVKLVANQNSTVIFRVSVEYKRKAPGTYSTG